MLGDAYLLGMPTFSEAATRQLQISNRELTRGIFCERGERGRHVAGRKNKQNEHTANCCFMFRLFASVLATAVVHVGIGF